MEILSSTGPLKHSWAGPSLWQSVPGRTNANVTAAEMRVACIDHIKCVPDKMQKTLK